MAPSEHTAEPPATVFVYGTLREPARADAVVDDWRYLGDAVLHGLHRVRGTYPTLAPGGSVGGGLLRTDELDRLDAYEGVGSGLYVRVSVPVSEVAAARDRVVPGESVSVYVGDPDRLDADASWPGTGSFAGRVRCYVDANDVVVSPVE